MSGERTEQLRQKAAILLGSAVPLNFTDLDPWNSNASPTRKLPPPRKPAREEEAKRVIEEYAASLREIIKTLRRHFN